MPKLEDYILSSPIIGNRERFLERGFSNGDLYNGDFKGALPHGHGRYSWSDGTVYEGDWEEGKMTRKGQISWPDGVKYEGDFSGDYLHGIGTFTGRDGSVYTGSWRMNIQHGYGKKQYSNSDAYEGCWKEGLREGSGRYLWSCGNMYIGNWKLGKMSGRGVMKWENGDLFDGSWLTGLRHGSGVYRYADGGYYFGTWTRGLKDGKGTFYPAGSKHPTIKKISSSIGCNDDATEMLSHASSLYSDECKGKKPKVKRSLSERILIGGILKNAGRISHRTTLSIENLDMCDPATESVCQDSSCTLPLAPEDCQYEHDNNSALVYEKEYVQGVLIKERIRDYAQVGQKTKVRNKFHAKQVQKKSFLTFFEGNQSYYLMLNLQLGIRYTVGKITPVPKREVRGSDFGDRARIRMYFPKRGSQFTPPHHSIDFHWKDYCPMVFRNLREMFKLDAADYMMSICGDEGLRELSSPGKSGSIFYLSHDDKFVIKTVKRSELKVLLKMLPHYYDHVKYHENTLITKFFGLHQITLKGGKKVRFVVMGNMFCTELRIHRRYDLKGSTHGRVTNKDKIEENTTLKDLDLQYEFQMDKLLRMSLFEQLSLDCKFLESQQIIDYSLLLGLHFSVPEHLRAILEHPGEGTTSQGLLIPPKSVILVTHEPSSVNTAPGPHIRGSALKAFSLGQKEVDLLLPGAGRLRVQLGVNMPAQANRRLQREDTDSAEVELFEVYDVVLYMGIIDILQEYNMKKRIEHACKSMQHDPLAISVAEPKLYAERFLNFLKKVFPEQTI